MDKYREKMKELIDEYKYQIIFGLLICIVLVGVYFFTNQSTQETSKASSSVSASALNQNEGNQKKEIKSNQHEQIFVDVKGAVINPGVYQATTNMRGTDLIRMAGGFNNYADRNHVNLAKKVTDQEILYIPVQGEVTGIPGTNLVNSENGSSNGSDSSSKTSGEKINLNEADATKMQTINGVGQKKAEKIIDYRNQNGPFKTVDDLKNVPGFGERTVANLKASLSV